MFKKVLIAFLFSVAAASALAEEGADAVVIGTVDDASRKPIAGATVTLTNTATGITSATITNSRGQYRTKPLQIGEYTIAVESKSFRRFIEAGLNLDIDSVVQVDTVLFPGEVSETVEVHATVDTLLQKSDATAGTVITNEQIEQLPLNGGGIGRDYLQLSALSSGTTPALGTLTGSTSGGVSIGGLSGSQVAFLLDGIDNNNQSILTAHENQKEIIKPSVDAINEFKVVTTSYSAEFGRSASGVVSVDLKSGSNRIHGSGYEFLRNNAVDAVPYFNSGNLPFKYNDFGGTLGGPILKDRTFIFSDLEFFRLRQQNTAYSLVPTDAQKSGNFSTAVYQPASYNSATGARTPFPYNPSTNTYEIGSGIDPIAQTLLQYYPEPNFVGTGALSADNYLFNTNSNANNYSWDIRVDQALTAKQSIFGRYSSRQVRNAIVASLPPLTGQYYAGSGAQSDNSLAFVLGYNLALSPTLLASVRAGWNKLAWVESFPKQTLTGVGIPGVATTAPGFSEITITNFATIGISNVPNADESENREIAADVTWLRGAHSLKFGWQEYWLQTNFNSSQLTSGIFQFNGQYTAKTPSATPTNDQMFADFLLGTVSGEQLSSPSILNFRSPYSHVFAQDDWKVTRTLNLNLGVRYELSPPAVDKFNKIANLDEDTNPSSPQLIYAGEFGSKLYQRALQNVNYTNVAPRVGFAFSPEKSRTVIRGGYGIFYANAITIGGMQSMENNPPVNQLRLSTSPSATSPTEYLQNGFATGALNLSNANGAKNVTLVSFDRHAAIPYDQQWSLSVQRALPFGIVAEAGYYGNAFAHNWWQVDGNPAPATAHSALPAGGINANRRYKSTTIPDVAGDPTIYLGTVSRVWKEGWSRYNGLQAKAEKRYSKGLTFIASYSYQKALGVGDTTQFQDPSNIRAEKAVVNTDLRNHFVGSGVYSLPFGRGKQLGANWNGWLDGAFGGWSVSPILTVSSGTPVNLTESKNPSNSGGKADRPNIVGDPYRAGEVAANPGCTPPAGSTRTPSQWFNPCAFTVQASGTYGDAPRNAIVGPGYVNLDAAVHKTLSLGERFKAQIRLESFNVANHPNLSSPAVNVQSPTTLGTITAIAGNPRQNQIAIKLLF